MILFVAIDVPWTMGKDLSWMQKGVSGARWRTAERLHITLGYFGQVSDDQAEELDRELAAKTFPAFDIKIAGGGHFGSKEPYAIWAGIKDTPELTELHEHCRKCARRVGIQMEARKFRPHITLAYMRPGAPVDRIAAWERNMNGFKCGPFLADEFKLFSSHSKSRGSNLYVPEASYPLLAAVSL